ncbi:MAG: hypothetical protein WD992_02185 [Candidatus Levyibacteriota bacterium]
MNKNVDIETLKAIYNAHRAYVIPALMIIASVFLVFFALIPQIQDLLTTLSERSIEQQKLQTLKSNLNLLTTTDEVDLDSKLGVALRALPQDKDFESILTTISSVADRAGIGLGNFEFRVGDIAGSAPEDNLLPSLGVTLVVSGGASGASRFMTDLAESLPISEVKKIDINVDFATILVAFYYKSLSSANISVDTRLTPLSAKQTELLDQLSSWNREESFIPAVIPVDLTVPAGTPSSSTLPF